MVELLPWMCFVSYHGLKLVVVVTMNCQNFHSLVPLLPLSSLVNGQCTFTWYEHHLILQYVIWVLESGWCEPRRSGIGFFTNTIFPIQALRFWRVCHDSAAVAPALTQPDLRGWAVPNLYESVFTVPSVTLQVTCLLWNEGWSCTI